MERPASATALGVAVLRAVDGNDPVALRLVDPDVVARARANDTVGAQRLRAHVVSRSRFAEERLAAAVARGVRQYVVLGAGFDTFAYRQPPWGASLRVVEVDHPASQRAKRERLAAAGIAVPPNVSYAAIDFATTALADGLTQTGFTADEPAFFSWLGVTMYLDEAAIDAVLRFVARCAPGSEVAFDFAPASADAPRFAEERATALGEPFLSRFTPETLEAKLRAHGFGTVDVVPPRLAAAVV